MCFLKKKSDWHHQMSAVAQAEKSLCIDAVQEFNVNLNCLAPNYFNHHFL